MGWQNWSHLTHWQHWILYSFMMVCLIFHTAMIINRKNWWINIKLHFENLSMFFFWKSELTHVLGLSLPLFVFVCFSMTFPLPSSSIDLLFEWPLIDRSTGSVSKYNSSAFQCFNYKANSKVSKYISV